MGKLMDDLILRKYFDQSAGYERVHIQINDISLIEMLGEFERQFDPKLAGEYSNIAAVELDRKGLTGDNSTDWVDILTCTCGELGCWSFQVRVRMDGDVVKWNAFRQPHRAEGNSDGEWSYTSFGPFQFNWASYSQQLEKIN